MDEQVKARLIGATVLVVVAVALVPELLSGPKRGAGSGAADPDKGTRTVVIDLGGAVANGSRVPPTEPPPAPVREASRLSPIDVPGEKARRDDPVEEPAAVEETGSASAPPVASRERIALPPAAATPVVAKPAPTVATSRTATAGSGDWAVQVGAFGSAESARKLVGQLQKDGLPSYVAPLNRNGKTLHRVRVGPVDTRADADKLAARVKARGLPASVVGTD